MKVRSLYYAHRQRERDSYPRCELRFHRYQPLFKCVSYCFLKTRQVLAHDTQCRSSYGEALKSLASSSVHYSLHLTPRLTKAAIAKISSHLKLFVTKNLTQTRVATATRAKLERVKPVTTILRPRDTGSTKLATVPAGAPDNGVEYRRTRLG